MQAEAYGSEIALRIISAYKKILKIMETTERAFDTVANLPPVFIESDDRDV
jgi:hypothetical protein